MVRVVTKKQRENSHLGYIVFLITCVLLGIAIVFLIRGRLSTRPKAQVGKKVVAYLVNWDTTRGLTSIQNNLSTITEISPWAYRIKNDGSGKIEFDPAGGGSEIITDTLKISEWHSQGKLVVPSIHNNYGGNWDWQVVHDIITNSTLRGTHITELVNEVISKNYDGIDIDYENATIATDKNAFSEFITELATALHARGKILSVTVYGKNNDEGFGTWASAQDYTALGNAADELRIMGYDYDLAVVGKISPMDWINSTLAYAKTKTSSEKIILGIPLYAISWKGINNERVGIENSSVLTWQDAKSLKENNNAQVSWDTAGGMYWFTYLTISDQKTVWYSDKLSTNTRLASTIDSNIAGIHVWRLGGEDPEVWTAIRNAFPQVTPSPLPMVTLTPTLLPTNTPSLPPAATPTSSSNTDTTPPTVQITSPQNGSTLSTRNVTVSAAATDNKAVTRVEIYIDNSLKVNDKRAPYEYKWDTRTEAKGSHAIKAVAYDVAGNSNYHQISVTK